jgi:glutathione S-transferase
VLELDDGRHLAESVAICRYFELLHPEPELFGKGAFEQATVLPLLAQGPDLGNYYDSAPGLPGSRGAR